MDRIGRLRYVAFGISAIGLGACSGGSNGPATTVGGTGSLSVSLMDAPVDDVDAVNVEIVRMEIKPVDGPAYDLPLTQSPYTTDLLALTQDNAAVLVDGAVIDAGDYEWLRMEMNAEIDTVFDSYVVETATGGWAEIRVPSGIVRLVGGFSVTANQAVELLFDWDMRKGLVKPPGLGGYILKPAFRVIGTTLYGSLSGSIPLSTVMDAANDCNADSTMAGDYDIGNVVYVFDGADVVVDDIDGLDSEPLATVEAPINQAGSDYEYSIQLPFGDYTVAFTCQAANDLAESSETGDPDPTMDTVVFFDSPVNVTVGPPGDVDVVQDF